MSGINSKRLKEHKEEILKLWEERCLKEVSAAGTTSTLALRNSIPLYLDHLSELIAKNVKLDFRSVIKRDVESTRIGKLHGADRASIRNYELSEVIFEYHILREVIFQFLEPEGPLDPVQRDLILDSIEQAVNNAAVEFSEIHTDIQQKFVNTLTHDLKTPITSAKLGSQMILRRTDIPYAVSNSASRIFESLNRLEFMIRDLLDGSRVRAGEALALQFAKCDVAEIARQVVDEMSISHGSRIKFESKGTVEGVFSGEGIRRAIENLLGNAIKYGFPDTPISVSIERVGSSVEIKVQNQGKPIPEGEIPILFEQYRRSKTAQEGSKAGWGLGLTIVKGVVDAHRGSVRVESTDKGTTFALQIPFAQDSVKVNES